MSKKMQIANQRTALPGPSSTRSVSSAVQSVSLNLELSEPITTRECSGIVSSSVVEGEIVASVVLVGVLVVILVPVVVVETSLVSVLASVAILKGDCS